jgi:hypothetical protein
LTNTRGASGSAASNLSKNVLSEPISRLSLESVNSHSPDTRKSPKWHLLANGQTCPSSRGVEEALQQSPGLVNAFGGERRINQLYSRLMSEFDEHWRFSSSAPQKVIVWPDTLSRSHRKPFKIIKFYQSFTINVPLMNL